MAPLAWAPLLTLILLSHAPPVLAQSTIPPDTILTVLHGDTIPGFGAVGGVSIDAVGYVYTADFRNGVWRYRPDGLVDRYGEGMYGASGNTVGPKGELYQSSFHGDYISRVDRDGSVETYADSGLAGPVGLVLGATGELYVTNCRGNTIGVVGPEREVRVFASGGLFACPNGITRDDRGDLYVVNFGNTQIVRVDPAGEATVFTDLPGAGGNGHIVYGRGGFYVTKNRGHQVFRVERDGSATVVAGTGERGHADGDALTSALSQPNGIAISPDGKQLWINSLLSGNGVGGGAARSVLQRIRLIALSDVLAAAPPGAEAVSAAYRAYRSARPHEDTTADAIAAAYGWLNPNRFVDAIRVFELNATDFPNHVVSQYQLGEGYRLTGQVDLARAQYTRALAVDSAHGLSRQRLAGLGAP